MYMKKEEVQVQSLVEHYKKYQDYLRYDHLLRHTVSAQRDMKKTNQVQFLLCHNGPSFLIRKNDFTVSKAFFRSIKTSQPYFPLSKVLRVVSVMLINTLYKMCSVHRGMFSTSGGYHEYIGDVQYIGGYHEYIGGIP